MLDNTRTDDISSVPMRSGRTRSVWFSTDRNGRTLAWEWRPLQIRSFRIPLDTARLWVATGSAKDIGGNPLKPPKGFG